MKKIAVIFFLFFMPFAALGQNTQIPAKIETTEDAGKWMTTYYRHKNPELVVFLIKVLGESGVFEATDTGSMFAMGFLASVFAENPEKLEMWFGELNSLPLNQKWALWSALGLFKTPKGQELLKESMIGLESQPKEFIKQLLEAPYLDPLTVEITDDSQVEILWGIFYATGDKRYAQRIISTLSAIQQPPDAFYGSGTKREAAEAAKKTLIEDATKHQLVMDICIQEKERQPEIIRKTLETIISEAQDNRTPFPGDSLKQIMRLESEDAQERLDAVLKLSNYPEKKVVEQLIRALSDSDARVKEAAIKAMANKNNRGATALILNTLFDRNYNLSLVARDVLVNMDDEQIVLSCVNIISRNKAQTAREVQARAHAAYILGQKKDSRAAGPLQELLAREENPVVKEFAQKAWENIKNKNE